MSLQALLENRSRWVKGIGVLMALLAILPVPAIALTLSRPPYRSQETRPVLAKLAGRMRTGDILYVYCPAKAAADFYGPAVGVTDYVAGQCHDSEEEFIDELRTLPEGRVWFFFTQWTPERPWPDGARAFLARQGRHVERIDDRYGLTGQSEAVAILYELGASGVRWPIASRIDGRVAVQNSLRAPSFLVTVYAREAATTRPAVRGIARPTSGHPWEKDPAGAAGGITMSHNDFGIESDTAHALPDLVWLQWGARDSIVERRG